MKKSAEIRQSLQEKIDAQKDIVEAAKDENGVERALTNDESVKFRAVQADIDALRTSLKDAEDYEANQRAAAAASGVRFEKPEAPEKKELRSLMKKYSLYRAVRSQLPNGRLDGVELEVHQETIKRAEKSGVAFQGVAIPSFSSSEVRADGQTVTQDSGGYGANLVPVDQQGVIEFLRPKPILQSLGSRFLTGLTGNLKFPVNNGGVTASWEGEITEVANTKNAYGSKTMEPHRLAAATLISLQNLYQSSPDLERMTIEDINAEVANKLDSAAINGPGSGNVPLGILNVGGINSVAAGTNGGAPTWAHIVALETAINIANANGAKMAYLINPGTKGKLKTTAHEANASNYLMGLDNTINGYAVGVSNLVPNNLTKGSGTDLNAGIFGDFSQLLMGQWGFYDLTVDNISKKKEGNIELVVNAFYDCIVRQDKAFSAIKDWSLV